MISVAEAINLVIKSAPRLSTQDCALEHLNGRVLAEIVAAPHDSPPFDNSAMDGFAVRAADLADAKAQHPVLLRNQGEIAAGDGAHTKLRPGAALRINTGALLPLGADAVVKIEDVSLEGASVKFSAPVPVGMAVRRAGEDYCTGQEMLSPGRLLDPATIGLIASMGMASVRVARKPSVALIATGDELVEPGTPLRAGQIYNSTRHALIPLLRSFGAEVHDLGSVTDDAIATRERLAEGLRHDVMITTGGVSMGSRDLVRPTLAELGVREVFWQVKQRPGKPIYFGAAANSGSGRHGTLCFGLPGNPVSVFVTALVYVRAAMLAMQGASDTALPWRPAIAGTDFKNTTGLTVFTRVNLAPAPHASGLPVVVPAPAQGSHQFSALSSSAGLVRIPEASATIASGQRLEFLDLRFI